MNESGATEALVTLSDEHFIVVWRNATKQPVSMAERVSQLIAHLPQPQLQTVLEFTQFLTTRHHQVQAMSVL